ncbi:MAG TPA: hypothetical protein VGI95_13370 [Caulobacteraceae bacterium]|jgi:hypothetical protein
MPDGLALPLLGFVATCLIALALVWPQGQGARSPAPFGHKLTVIPADIPQIAKRDISKGAFSLRGPEPVAKSARH